VGRDPADSGVCAAGTADFKPERKALLDGFARRWRWLEWLATAILCALLLGQALLSDGRLSQICDESTHLYAGYRYWRCGDFGYGSEHPPLPKLVAALPLLATGGAVDCAVQSDEADAALDWLYAMPDWETALARARAAASVFALGLCVLVWVAARRMFGFTAAVVATTLLAFDPNILASSGLVMTDMAVTFAFPFAIYAYYLYFGDGSFGYGWGWKLALAGVATGTALTAKNSGIVVLPVLLLLAVGDVFVRSDAGPTRVRGAMRNLGGAALICAIAVGVVWMVYGLQFSARPHSDSDDYWVAVPSSSEVLATAHDWHLLPEAYLGGLHGAASLATDDAGPALLGHTFPHREWFFFPVAMLVKSTAAVLLLLALGGIGLRYVGRERGRELLYLLLPAGVFLLACMSAVNSMMRHVLPVYPFLFLAIAAAAVELARRYQWVRYAVPVLLVLHAASSLHAYPFYLSYANELFGGPSKLYKRLPNSDMGEGIKEVRVYVARHGSTPCWILSPYRMNPDFYRTGCAPLMWYGTGEWAPRPGIASTIEGTVFVSSTLLPRIARFPTLHGDQRGLFTAFAERPANDVIAGSAELVFKGEFNTLALATKGEAFEADKMLGSGEVREGLLHARRAAELDPSDAAVRGLLCVALVANGSQAGGTRSECEAAQTLLEKDSLTHTKMYGVVHKYVETLRSGGTGGVGDSP
jgi:hypothetical protein